MLIKVKVFPDTKEEGVIEKSKDSFEVRVKEKPVMGLANKRTIQLLSYYFEIPESKIRLIKGFRERNKIFEVII
ncbi:MAG: DUF167 domain-containing protein [bacterium]|nr:DUF167 domain-containing protein [bacterium]